MKIKDGVAHICSVQEGASEIGTYKAGIRKICTVQIGAAKRCKGQIRTTEGRSRGSDAFHLLAVKDQPIEYSARQLGASKIKPGSLRLRDGGATQIDRAKCYGLYARRMAEPGNLCLPQEHGQNEDTETHREDGKSASTVPRVKKVASNKDQCRDRRGRGCQRPGDAVSIPCHSYQRDRQRRPHPKRPVLRGRCRLLSLLIHPGSARRAARCWP